MISMLVNSARIIYWCVPVGRDTPVLAMGVACGSDGIYVKGNGAFLYYCFCCVK